MTRQPETGPSIEIAAAGAEPPARIEILPLGRIDFADGRPAAQLDDAAAVIAASGDRPILIDFDHSAEGQSRTTRAAGWITHLEVEGDRLMADVDWTEEGAAALRGRSYRYISPVFLIDKRSRRVAKLERAGLTNVPALPQLRAVASRQTEESSEMDPHLKEIAEALGLGEDAGATAVVAAVKDTSNDLARMQTEVAEAAAAKPDPAKWAPRDALDALSREVAALKTARAAEAAETAVAAAKSAGKLAPALEGWAIEYAARDPQGFAAWVEAAPAIVQPGAAAATGAAPTREAGLSDTEKAICRQMGVSEDAYRAALTKEH